MGPPPTRATRRARPEAGDIGGGQPGLLTVIQRFGSGVNLDVPAMACSPRSRRAAPSTPAGAR
jgi:hypothetical protein